MGNWLERVRDTFAEWKNDPVVRKRMLVALGACMTLCMAGVGVFAAKASSYLERNGTAAAGELPESGRYTDTYSGRDTYVGEDSNLSGPGVAAEASASADSSLDGHSEADMQESDVSADDSFSDDTQDADSAPEGTASVEPLGQGSDGAAAYKDRTASGVSGKRRGGRPLKPRLIQQDALKAHPFRCPRQKLLSLMEMRFLLSVRSAYRAHLLTQQTIPPLLIR